MLDLVRDIDVLSTFEVHLMQVSRLRRTERHNPQRASRLAMNIAAEGKWTNPIWVESNDLLIMDGHHRLEAAILLGLVRLPCALLSYHIPELSVVSWNGNAQFPIADIFAAGRTQSLLPYKTTRHILTCAMPEASYDLADLR
jgi:ParB-like chromosome segregation protein Spo0J